MEVDGYRDAFTLFYREIYIFKENRKDIAYEEGLYEGRHFKNGRRRGCGVYPSAVYRYVRMPEEHGDYRKPVGEGAEQPVYV